MNMIFGDEQLMNRSYKMVIFCLLVLAVFGSILFLSNGENNEVIPESENGNNAQNTTGKITSDSDGDDVMDHTSEFKDSDKVSIFNHDGWELVWHDEFEDSYLDLTKWNIEDWAAQKNNELQYYSPNNVIVKNGFLRLISKAEKYQGKNYTSGAVHTKNKFDFLYGKAEMRAKLPAGQGMFPAFWMMTDKEHTWLPEIDIMEMLGHLPNEVWMVAHWLGEDGALKSESTSFRGPDFSSDFHTFSVEWTPDSLTWFIDGAERFKTNTYIPSEKMYLYLNTAVGGNWPGYPDHTTIFPTIFEIDYVRVFKQVDE